MAQMEIKLAVVVGDNGNWAATKYMGSETDWGFLSDSVGVYDGAKREVVYQTTERQFVITALVEAPSIETVPACLVEKAD